MKFYLILSVLLSLLTGCAVPASRWRDDAFSRYNSAVSAGSKEFAPEETDNIRQTLALADRYFAQRLSDDAERLYRLSCQKSQLLYRNLVLSKVRKGSTLVVQSNDTAQPQVIAIAPEPISMKQALAETAQEQHHNSAESAVVPPSESVRDNTIPVDEAAQQKNETPLEPPVASVIRHESPATKLVKPVSEAVIETTPIPASTQHIPPTVPSLDVISAPISPHAVTVPLPVEKEIYQPLEIATIKPVPTSETLLSERKYIEFPSETTVPPTAPRDIEEPISKPAVPASKKQPVVMPGTRADKKTVSSPIAKRLEPGNTVIYLTFDDGPSRLTLPIANFLNSQGISATFFALGSNIKGHEKVIKETVALGHRVGNHTLSHDLRKLNGSLHQQNNEIEKTAAMLDKLGGDGKMVRIPYGASNKALSITVAAEGGQIFDWDINSLDSSKRGAKDSGLIEKTVLSQLQKSGKRHIVLLFHDGTGHDATLTAIRRLIPRLKQEGYRFGLLSRSDRVARSTHSSNSTP